MNRVWASEIDGLVIRQNVRVTVVQAEQYDPGFPPSDLLGFLAWVKDIVEQVPEEYRATAEFEIGSTSSYYDSHYANVELTYSRPETDEEWEARKQNVMARVRAVEEQERRVLADLQRKYAQGTSASG